MHSIKDKGKPYENAGRKTTDLNWVVTRYGSRVTDQCDCFYQNPDKWCRGFDSNRFPEETAQVSPHLTNAPIGNQA